MRYPPLPRPLPRPSHNRKVPRRRWWQWRLRSSGSTSCVHFSGLQRQTSWSGGLWKRSGSQLFQWSWLSSWGRLVVLAHMSAEIFCPMSWDNIRPNRWAGTRVTWRSTSAPRGPATAFSSQQPTRGSSLPQWRRPPSRWICGRPRDTTGPWSRFSIDPLLWWSPLNSGLCSSGRPVCIEDILLWYIPTHELFCATVFISLLFRFNQDLRAINKIGCL